jgi:hypothetical protein
MSYNLIDMGSYCCICIETEPETSYEHLICCKNKVHTTCYINWLMHKGVQATCPMCRVSVNITKIPYKMFLKHTQNIHSFSETQQINIQDIHAEYFNQQMLFVIFYVSVFFGIGILLCLIISLLQIN